MTNRECFFNIDDSSLGIQRELAPGLSARIFVGDQAMLSVVTIAPNAEGSIHSHPQEQWGERFSRKGSGSGFVRAASEDEAVAMLAAGSLQSHGSSSDVYLIPL